MVWAAAGHPAAVFSTTYDELAAMTGAPRSTSRNDWLDPAVVHRVPWPRWFRVRALSALLNQRCLRRLRQLPSPNLVSRGTGALAAVVSRRALSALLNQRWLRRLRQQPSRNLVSRGTGALAAVVSRRALSALLNQRWLRRLRQQPSRNLVSRGWDRTNEIVTT